MDPRRALSFLFLLLIPWMIYINVELILTIRAGSTQVQRLVTQIDHVESLILPLQKPTIHAELMAEWKAEVDAYNETLRKGSRDGSGAERRDGEEPHQIAPELKDPYVRRLYEELQISQRTYGALVERYEGVVANITHWSMHWKPYIAAMERHPYRMLYNYI